MASIGADFNAAVSMRMVVTATINRERFARFVVIGRG
jgi:hypothetical protein